MLQTRIVLTGNVAYELHVVRGKAVRPMVKIKALDMIVDPPEELVAEEIVTASATLGSMKNIRVYLRVEEGVKVRTKVPSSE